MALIASELRFRNILAQAPMGITILMGADFKTEMANEALLKIVDKKETDFVGKALFESMPEIKETVEPLLTGILKTGVPYYGFEFPVTIDRYGKNETVYFNFVCHPLKEADGDLSRIIVVATDVSTSVKAKHLLQESENRFRNMVMQSPVAKTILRGRIIL
ncbi:MAG: PAS domain-containing protein [Bacteroidota bacterium]